MTMDSGLQVQNLPWGGVRAQGLPGVSCKGGRVGGRGGEEVGGKRGEWRWWWTPAFSSKCSTVPRQSLPSGPGGTLWRTPCLLLCSPSVMIGNNWSWFVIIGNNWKHLWSWLIMVRVWSWPAAPRPMCWDDQTFDQEIITIVNLNIHAWWKLLAWLLIVINHYCCQHRCQSMQSHTSQTF